MSIKELRGKSPADLSTQLLDLRREQFNLRMQKGAGQLTQTHQVRKVRREIAQIKTLLGANK
jgi:large subunit ribosomal protein L29